MDKQTIIKEHKEKIERAMVELEVHLRYERDKMKNVNFTKKLKKEEKAQQEMKLDAVEKQIEDFKEKIEFIERAYPGV